MNSLNRQINNVLGMNSNSENIFLLFSVFNKISSIKMHPKCIFGLRWKIKIILLFSLFLLLFMSSTVFFGTSYGFHYTISTIFYLYL